MVALIFLFFVAYPGLVALAIDVESPEGEDGFPALQPSPGAGDLQALFDEMTASAFEHACRDGIPLGQGVGIILHCCVLPFLTPM